MHFEQHTELDNLITMQNLRPSAKGSNDAYDVHTSLTVNEPNDVVFSEVGNSSGSFSYMTPSSDLDIDDTTLGKLLTAAHREHADYCDPEGLPVSQSSLSVLFDRTGKPVGERSVDQSIGLVSPETRTVLTASFLKTPKVRKWSIEQGSLWEKTAQMHRLGPYLMNRDRWSSQSIVRKLVITNSKQLEPKKRRILREDFYGDRKWIFVKFINKVLPRWRNYENSKVLLSIRS